MKRLLLLAGVFPAALFGGGFDFSAYDRLLRAHVNEAGWVDYEGIRADTTTELSGFIDSAAAARLSGWTPEQKLSFWINIYNALVIKGILENPGLEKITDESGFFDRPFNVAGGVYTLNDIEHRIIRGKKKNGKGPIPGVTLDALDPRVHFALVCGAADGPRLLNKIYAAKTLDATLESNARRFANSPKHLRIEKGRLRVSSIMKWYAEDFTAVEGPAEYLSGLIAPARRPDAKEIKKLLQYEYSRADFQFDWRVNDVKNAAP